MLEAAQSAAAVAVRPGLAAERVDAIARERIAAAGYGPNFIHRIGHGIGLEGHEEPYLVAGSERVLREGMAFSVEPGIYLEGRYGAAHRGHRRVRRDRPGRPEPAAAVARDRRRLTPGPAGSRVRRRAGV